MHAISVLRTRKIKIPALARLLQRLRSTCPLVQGDAQGAGMPWHGGCLRALAYNSDMSSSPPGGASGNGSKPRDVASRATAQNPGASRPSSTLVPARPTTVTDPLAVNSPRPTIPCPKCGAPARDVARFCQRCHMTLRFECPSCHHEQRTGGKCEKCGVDFLKYVTAVVAAKQAESDAVEDRNERRSKFLSNILSFPFLGPLRLVRFFTRPSESSRRR